MATGGDAVVVDPEGKVGVGPAVGGAGDPEIAAADPAVGQRSKVIEEGMRGLGMGRYTGCHLSLFSTTLGANPALVGQTAS